MTIDQLLKKRYKVVIRYPHYPFDGDVLIVDDNGELIHETEGYCQSIYKIMEKDIKNCGCFREMQWHEERGEEDMPSYVKSVENGQIYKVDRFDMQTSSPWFMYLEGDARPHSPSGSALANTHFLPATEMDYLNYSAKN